MGSKARRGLLFSVHRLRFSLQRTLAPALPTAHRSTPPGADVLGPLAARSGPVRSQTPPSPVPSVWDRGHWTRTAREHSARSGRKDPTRTELHFRTGAAPPAPKGSILLSPVHRPSLSAARPMRVVRPTDIPCCRFARRWTFQPQTSREHWARLHLAATEAPARLRSGD